MSERFTRLKFLFAKRGSLPVEKNESDKKSEKKIISDQMKLYKMGKGENKIYLYDYGRSQLHPTYTSQVLDPFIQKIKKNNITPCALDLGAGRGETSAYLETKGIKMIKADISQVGLRWQKDAVQAMAWKLPFTENSFDGIHSKDMMTHIPPEFREKMFSELNRITKPEGIVTLCSADEQEAELGQYPTSKNNLVEIAEKNGFTLVNTKKWHPAKDLKDWYSTKRTRFVLELRKPNRPQPISS